MSEMDKTEEQRQRQLQQKVGMAVVWQPLQRSFPFS
jgi:hypothetical protein